MAEAFRVTVQIHLTASRSAGVGRRPVHEYR
jgi:hypothetical protein